MSIHAVPDERSVKRLGTRLVRAQRQQKARSSERAFKILAEEEGFRRSQSERRPLPRRLGRAKR